MKSNTRRVLLSSLIASTVVATAGAGSAGTACTGSATRQARSKSGRLPVAGAVHTAALEERAAADLLSDGGLQDRVRRYLERAHGARPEEAEDAAQEAALRALGRGIRAASTTGFAAWLRRTAQNALFDARKKQRSVRLPDEPESLNAALGASAEHGPGDLLEVRDGVEQILASHDLAALTPRKKALLGSAIGERLTAGLGRRAPRVTQPAELVEVVGPALAGLAAADAEVVPVAGDATGPAV